MSNIALIGNREVIIGFSLMGFQLFPANNANEALSALENCSKDNYAIVFITNEIAQKILTDIAEYQKQSSMSICILPNRSKETELSLNLLRRNVERAIGTDILFRKEG